jgi:hypothetical protein
MEKNEIKYVKIQDRMKIRTQKGERKWNKRSDEEKVSSGCKQTMAE